MGKEKTILRTAVFVVAVSLLLVSTMPLTSLATTQARTLNKQGWGGWIVKMDSSGKYSESLSKTYVQTLVSDLSSKDYNLIRYQSRASFLGNSEYSKIRYPVLDLLISKSLSYGITVVIDPIHDFPPETESYEVQSNYSAWLAALKEVGYRYNGKSNVILECINEYKLSDAYTKFQRIVTDLRNAGITLPLHFNYMWNSVGELRPLTDPLNKVSVGHHVYGNHDNDWRKPYSGESWLSYCKRVGVEITLTKMFTSSEKLWFGYPLSQGRAVMCTEVGASIRYKYTPWNIAYVMRLLEYAEKHGVGATVFRTGYLSDKNIYEQKAKEYFGRSFHIAGNGSPEPDKSQSNSPAESTAMPVATFILSSASPLVDQTVTLDASRSYDLDGNIVSYKWTFGDGTTTSKTVPTTTHVYTEDGTYTIRLMITDNSGKTDTGTKIITVRRTTSSLSISISPNPTTTKAGTQIKGALATGGPNLDIKISYRKTGSQTWNTLATTKTNPDGYYSFRWFPTEAGDYELKANWPGDSTLLPAQTPVIAFVCQHIQTLITIHTSASSTIFGLNTSISGTLANMYGDPLEDENIVLSYRFRGVQNWILITSDKTDAAGNYSVAWVPMVTGYYVIKAEWSGNSTHNATNSTATLSSISYKDQILAVESNSSTSQLSYNGSSRSLSFLVTGPTDSRGYARITVAKTLIGNSSRVFLDGVEKNFSVLTGDDSWVLCIDYSHSVHQVVVYLDVAPIPEMPLFMFLPLFMILSGACTVLARKRLPSLRET